jgi:hypothetical protein
MEQHNLMSLPLDGTAQRPPKRCSGVQIVSATHTGDKRMSVGKCMPADGTTAAHYLLAHGSLGALRSQGSPRVAYARQIEIVMRPATIISILRESHLPFSKNDYNSNRPHTSLCVPNVWPAPDLQVDFYDLVSISLQ